MKPLTKEQRAKLYSKLAYYQSKKFGKGLYNFASNPKTHATLKKLLDL